MMIVSGDEVFGNWFGHESSASTPDINVLINEAPERPLSSFHNVRAQQEGASQEKGKGFHQSQTMLLPWSWTSILHNNEKLMSIVD